MQTPQYILAISALLLSTALGTQRAGAFTEPWQVWVKQPIATPMTMATIVTADSGAQVQFSVAGNTYTNTGLGGGQKSTNIFYVPVKAHQQYPLQISGSSWSEAEVHFTPYVSRQLLAKRGKQAMPKPYKSFINNSETNDFDAAYQSSGNHATNFLLEVRPDNGFRPSFLAGLEDRWSRDEDATSALAPGDGYFPEIGPGRSTNAWSGAFRWGVSLGRLWNGSPCGMVRLDEVALGGSLYSAAPLTYTARSTNTAELLLVTNSTGQLRQIRAPQTLLDVQATNSPNEECILKFYLLSQVGSTTNSSGLFPINTDDPFVVWHVKNPDSPGTSNRVQFIEVRPGRTITSEVQYSNLVWSLKTGSGAELRTETRTVSVSGPVRTETVEIKSPTNSVYKALERYKSFAWGWELTNVISDPDGAKLTNSFTYYEDSNDQLEFGKLKDHVYPGGRWERSCYMNSPDCPGWPLAGYFGYYGAYTEMVIRPWMDGPSDVSGATVDNVVQDATTYTGIDIGAHTSWDHEQFFGIADYYTNETSWTTGIDGGSETGNIVIDYSDDIIGRASSRPMKLAGPTSAAFSRAGRPRAAAL